TYKGLSEYDLKMDSFNHLDGSSQNSISYVINRPNGTKILANYEGGVAITKADSVVAFFSHSTEDPNSLASTRVSSLALQGDSLLWVGHYDKGLDKIDLRKNSITRIHDSNPSLPENINTLYTDDIGNLWIGSNDGIRIITNDA